MAGTVSKYHPAPPARHQAATIGEWLARATEAVAREAGATAAQLIERDWRGDELVQARWALMVALQWRGLSLKAIARRVKRDHSTVAYGLRKAEQLDWAPGTRFRTFIDLAAAA